jgi:hypothetical protein
MGNKYTLYKQSKLNWAHLKDVKLLYVGYVNDIQLHNCIHNCTINILNT